MQFLIFSLPLIYGHLTVFVSAASYCKNRSSLGSDDLTTVFETTGIEVATTVNSWVTEWVTARVHANANNRRNLFVPFADYDDNGQAMVETVFTSGDCSNARPADSTSSVGGTGEFTWVDEDPSTTYSTSYSLPGKRQTVTQIEALQCPQTVTRNGYTFTFPCPPSATSDLPWCDEQASSSVLVTTTTAIEDAAPSTVQTPTSSLQTQNELSPTISPPTNCITSPMPLQSGVVKNCNKFYKVTTGDDCNAVAHKNSIAYSDVVAWNPSAEGDCMLLYVGRFACVGTTTCLTTPAPIQSGMVTNCDKFYKVAKGEDCNTVASKNGIAYSDVVNWNPEAKPDCTQLYADNYACVHTSSCIWRCSETPITPSTRQTLTHAPPSSSNQPKTSATHIAGSYSSSRPSGTSGHTQSANNDASESSLIQSEIQSSATPINPSVINTSSSISHQATQLPSGSGKPPVANASSSGARETQSSSLTAPSNLSLTSPSDQSSATGTASQNDLTSSMILGASTNPPVTPIRSIGSGSSPVSPAPSTPSTSDAFPNPPFVPPTESPSARPPPLGSIPTLSSLAVSSTAPLHPPPASSSSSSPLRLSTSFPSGEILSLLSTSSLPSGSSLFPTASLFNSESSASKSRLSPSSQPTTSSTTLVAISPLGGSITSSPNPAPSTDTNGVTNGSRTDGSKTGNGSKTNSGSKTTAGSSSPPAATSTTTRSHDGNDVPCIPCPLPPLFRWACKLFHFCPPWVPSLPPFPVVIPGFDPNDPDPTGHPPSPPISPPGIMSPTQTRPPSSNPTSDSSCTDTTATHTTIGCYRNGTSTLCTTIGTQVTTGCTAVGAVTTEFCSMKTVTDAIVYCASGTSGSCSSTSTMSTIIVSGCDITATTATTFAPACPARITASPDDDQGESGEDFLPPTAGYQLQCVDPKSNIIMDNVKALSGWTAWYWCQNPGDGVLWDTFEGVRRVWTIDYTYDNVSHPPKVVELVVATDLNNTDYMFNDKQTKDDCTTNLIKILQDCEPVSGKNSDNTVGGCSYNATEGVGFCVNLYELVAGVQPPMYSGPKPMTGPTTENPTLTTTHSSISFPPTSSVCTTDCSTGSPEPQIGHRAPLSDDWFRVMGFQRCGKPEAPISSKDCYTEWFLFGNRDDEGMDSCDWLVAHHKGAYREDTLLDVNNGPFGSSPGPVDIKNAYPQPINPKSYCLANGLWNDLPQRETYRLPQNCTNGNNIWNGPMGLHECAVWSRAPKPLDQQPNIGNENGVYMECRSAMSCCVPDYSAEDIDCKKSINQTFANSIYSIPGPGGVTNAAADSWVYYPQLKCNRKFCFDQDGWPGKA